MIGVRARWRESLREIGFFDQGKEEHMMMAFRRIFARGKLSEADANIMMGVVRQVQWKFRHTEPQASPEQKA